MREIRRFAGAEGLDREEIRQAVAESLWGEHLKHALIIPPDFTRLHSNAGYLTNLYYHLLSEQGCQVDILPGLGTHVPMNAWEIRQMYGDIPLERFFVHDWRRDVIPLGEVPAEFLRMVTDGIWQEPIPVEINRMVMDPKYDLILSVGQVVPHEVVGMANHAKNLFVGVGGAQMIHQVHMVGAVYGMERMMGRDHSPVRRVFDYAMEHFLAQRPVTFVLTVCTARKNQIFTHGLLIGSERKRFEEAVQLSQQWNMQFVNEGFQKCVVYLDPQEFKSTWLGNKAIYRTRMAMADGGMLIVLAPGVRRFGEDEQVDRLIRKYGYRGRKWILEQFSKPGNQDLRDNMGAAAHLIHGSSDGRFQICYAVQPEMRSAVEAVGFLSADYEETMATYCVETLRDGINDVHGEQVFFVSNPALGLWAERSRFFDSE